MDHFFFKKLPKIGTIQSMQLTSSTSHCSIYKAKEVQLHHNQMNTNMNHNKEEKVQRKNGRHVHLCAIIITVLFFLELIRNSWRSSWVIRQQPKKLAWIFILTFSPKILRGNIFSIFTGEGEPFQRNYLYIMLTLRIKCTGSFIKNQNVRVSKNRPCNSYPLLLTPTKQTITHKCLIPIGKRWYKPMRKCLFSSEFHVFVINFSRATVTYVWENICSKKARFLQKPRQKRIENA